MSEREQVWRTRSEWAQVVGQASQDTGVLPMVSPTNKRRVGQGYSAAYIESAKHLNTSMAREFENGLRKSNNKILFGLEPQIVAAKKAIRLFAKKHSEAEEKAWADRVVALLSTKNGRV